MKMIKLIIITLFTGAVMGERIHIDDHIVALDPDESGNTWVRLALNELPDSDGDEIPGEYLAVLTQSVSAQSDVAKLITQLDSEYNVRTLRQFTIGSMKILMLEGDDADVTLAKRSMVDIEYVEPNKRVYMTQEDVCMEQMTGQYEWNRDRTDQRTAVEDITSGMYTHSTGDDGEGVDVYILDTGIYVDHDEFEGRAVWGYTAYNITDGDIDGNGHGTHVAGTVGAVIRGIAKNTMLIAVKVLDNSGSGSTAGLVDAVEWVLMDHAQKEITRGSKPKAVLNLSLGMNGTSVTLESALSNLIAEGLSAVVAAGNSYEDACNYSPARVPNAITVGASDYFDQAVYFTNWGTCVDIFAPGYEVLSTFIESPTSLAVASGTSMSAPHVTGVVARYLSTLDSAPSPADVTVWIIEQSTSDALSFFNANEASSPNKLLYAECYYGDGHSIKPTIISVVLLLVTFIGIN